MNNFAVIKTGGKQYIAKKGEALVVDKLVAEENKNVEFDKVLLVVNEKGMQIGKPYLKEVKVVAKVVNQAKGEKLRIARFRAKSRYRKVTGFRRMLTEVKIVDIK
jgi:large subunit ribosomal protein L21